MEPQVHSEVTDPEPQVRSEVTDPRCAWCGAPVSSKAHVHRCLHDRLDAVCYTELFWEEA